MRRFLKFIGFVVFACLLVAGGMLFTPLRTPLMAALSKALSENGVELRENIAYGALPRHKLDHYLPQNREQSSDDSARPIVIFYYGGAWRSGDRRLYHFVGAALAAAGIETIIPDYRLYPDVRFPAFVDDAALAYGWVWRKLAAKQNRPIFVMGHSAGAHIAALLAYDRTYVARQAQRGITERVENVARPSGFIGLAGPYAFNPVTWPSTKEIFASLAKDQADKARPVSFVEEQSPPSLLFHGLRDDVVQLYNQSDLAKALRRKNVFVRALTYEHLAHIGLVLTLSRPLRGRAPVLAETLRFIREQSGGSSKVQARIK